MSSSATTRTYNRHIVPNSTKGQSAMNKSDNVIPSLKKPKDMSINKDLQVKRAIIDYHSFIPQWIHRKSWLLIGPGSANVLKRCNHIVEMKYGPQVGPMQLFREGLQANSETISRIGSICVFCFLKKKQCYNSIITTYLK